MSVACQRLTKIAELTQSASFPYPQGCTLAFWQPETCHQLAVTRLASLLLLQLVGPSGAVVLD